MRIAPPAKVVTTNPATEKLLPENFPQSLKMFYPIIYNYSYLIVEAVITIIIISIPAVASGLKRVKQTAVA